MGMVREILESRREYQNKISTLENELFATNYKCSSRISHLEYRLDQENSRVNELSRLLDNANLESASLEKQLTETKQELLEARAKYVDLVNNQYECYKWEREKA